MLVVAKQAYVQKSKKKKKRLPPFVFIQQMSQSTKDQ